MIIKDDHILFTPLLEIGWVGHCFTTRNFRPAASAAHAGRAEIVAAAVETILPHARSYWWGEQIHGGAAAVCRAGGPLFSEIPGVDALTCSDPGVCLVAFAADCPVVFIVDREKRAVALVHSGRRGCGERVVTECLRRMEEEHGTSPADCLAVISPSIGPCCYPVDLWAEIGAELAALGVGSVVNPRVCTSCRADLFFSYRREKGRCGRMLAAIFLRRINPA